MAIPEERRAWFKAEAIERLAKCPESAGRRFLLCEFVQAYMPLEGPQLDEFKHLLTTKPYVEARKMATTWYEEGIEKGIEEGIEKGIEKGECRMLRRLIEERFGPLSASAVARLEAWPAERLEEVGLKLLRAVSLEELSLGEDRRA
jgi:hypothetical protein